MPMFYKVKGYNCLVMVGTNDPPCVTEGTNELPPQRRGRGHGQRCLADGTALL